MLPCRNGHQPIRAHAKLRTGWEGGGEIKTEGRKQKRVAKKVARRSKKRDDGRGERKDKRQKRCERGKKKT